MILATLVTILIGLYLYLQYIVHRKKQSFKKRNIPPLEGQTYLFFLKALVGWKHQSELVDEIYWNNPERDAVAIVGLMAQVIIRNPDWIERILIKDFAFFHDRIKTDGQIKNPMDANIALLSGNTWRAVRSKFSPLFTSGKLRFMYEAISDCGKELSLYLDRKDGQEVDMCEVMGLFAMDVIGSTAYGIEPNVLKNPDSEFRKVGKEIFDINLWDTLKIFILISFPKFARLLGVKGIAKADAQEYFCRVVRDTLKYREEGGYSRNDFIQMLLALKSKGKIEMQITDPGDDYLLMEKSSETFAMRFAMLEMKFALVTLIRDFDFTVSNKNKFPIKIAARQFVKTPEDGIIFHVKKRNPTVE